MKVVLGFPWRATEDRLEAYEVTTDVVPKLYDFDFVYTADSGHQTFNRCASRNLIFEIAEKNEADVVVCCDADSIPEEAPLREAIESALDGLMHFPFHEAWYLSPKAVPRIRLGQTTEQIRSRIFDKCPSEGGIWVCKPEAWWKAGGQDPRLANWGCDDRAFLAASRTMVGMPIKHHGILYCLPHVRPSEGEIWVPKEVELLVDYESRYKNPTAMQKLIHSRLEEVHPNPTVHFLKGG